MNLALNIPFCRKRTCCEQKRVHIKHFEYKKKSLIDIPLVDARSCPGGRNCIFVTLLFECFVEFSAKKKILKDPFKTAQQKNV